MLIQYFMFLEHIKHQHFVPFYNKNNLCICIFIFVYNHLHIVLSCIIGEPKSNHPDENRSRNARQRFLCFPLKTNKSNTLQQIG